jgi:signal transduction histidine kinase
VTLGGGVRSQDLAWLLLFAALAWASPIRAPAEFELLGALAAFQIAEPRIPRLQAGRGPWWGVGVKLLLAYMLVGVTGGITSSYYLILIVPVVSAATRLGGWATAATTLGTAGAYLSFLLYIDWSRYEMPPNDVSELALRIVIICMIAFLTHELVGESRTQARRYQATAEQLAQANTNLQAAEAAVRRSERLAALGQLTAGLAHELRNPLGTMKASADLLLKKLSAHDDVERELAGYITSEVDRLNSLIAQFLEFARPVEPKREKANLNDVLDRGVAELERRQPPFPVTIYKNYSPDIPPFPMDAVLMERVVSNLLINAAQASSPGSAVTLKTRALDNAVEIAVIDRGSGVKPADRENIFNPFFTTKPDGTGLGLALVARIVDGHGGTMAVESEPGEGSVFRVLLPIPPS